MRRLRRFLGALMLLGGGSVLVGCSSGPVVRTLPDYRSGSLRAKRVLFVRLAVSDDFEDARTGVMLSGRTRSGATREACARVAREWSVGTVVCPPADGDQPISELERLFAKNETIPDRVLRTARARSNADLLLLFRPESVGATQEISQQKLNDDPFLGPSGTAIPTSVIVSGTHAAPIHTTNETELTYTIAGWLIDLRTGKRLKSGTHSGSASNTVKHNSGFAVAPPAVPLLADIMTDLAEALLEE